eukprot:CAMPEP_0172583752 /NCGR_PEP_ID=MMETSP1068-20121228/3307_1 /TAXON_ID=35684 /ORGANISM="Pseudopedinella elastica, Strain CCMP716" /LENGTH=340 /DNA_ID=CAMNT_0013377651 /DNA_START=65 /DNA_END=1087 /DNA_ORIENTATION=+
MTSKSRSLGLVAFLCGDVAVAFQPYVHAGMMRGRSRWSSSSSTALRVLETESDTGESSGGYEEEAAAQSLRALGMSEADVKARLTGFALFDTNKDGLVDPQELKLGLEQRFGTVATDEELASVMREFDTGGLGGLTPETFVLGQIKRRIEVGQTEERAAASEARRLAAQTPLEAVTEAAGIEVNEDNGLGVRAASCVPYILPLVDATKYGFPILSQAPVLATALFPFVALFQVVPFASLICFFFFSSQSRNMGNPRLLRFNLQHAILLDIALFIPSLVALLPIPGEVSALLGEPVQDLVFLGACGIIFYCWATNLVTGTNPNGVPFLGDAAEEQTGGASN